jgi:hypothetical protein
MTCTDCDGSRAVPDDLSSGYLPCPSCVNKAQQTWVVWESLDGGNTSQS